MRYKTILFDLDGTLIDTKPGILKSVKATLLILGITPPPDDALVRFLGPPTKQSFTDVCGLSPQLADKAAAIYRRHLVESGNIFDCTVYEGIGGLLMALKSAGLRLGVATLKAEPIAAMVLDHTGLTDYFDAVCGPAVDNLGATKADSIMLALTRIEDADMKTSVLIGDRCYDAHGAAQAGIDSIGVFYGYGTREEIKANPFTLTCETVKDLETLLLANAKLYNFD